MLKQYMYAEQQTTHPPLPHIHTYTHTHIHTHTYTHTYTYTNTHTHKGTHPVSSAPPTLMTRPDTGGTVLSTTTSDVTPLVKFAEFTASNRTTYVLLGAMPVDATVMSKLRVPALSTASLRAATVVPEQPRLDAFLGVGHSHRYMLYPQHL